MTAFKKGSTVRQKLPEIQGEVTSTRFNEDAQALEYHVSYTDAAGHPHARWFLEHELESAEPVKSNEAAPHVAEHSKTQPAAADIKKAR